MIRSVDSPRYPTTKDFLVPPTFNVASILPSDLQKRRDCARWFLQTLYVKAALCECDADGYVNMHHSILRSVMGREDGRRIINALVESGFVECRNSYRPGKYSRGYRLHPRLLTMSWERVPVRDRRLVTRLEKNLNRRRQKQMETWEPIHRKLNDAQRALTITKDANLLLKQMTSHGYAKCTVQEFIVENIQAGNFHFSVGSTRRCYNAITNLRRELRPFLRLAGQPIAGVDIKCTQPALLGVLFNLVAGHEVTTYLVNALCRRCSFVGETPPWEGFRVSLQHASDAIDFAELASKGLLYDRLVKCCGDDGILPVERPRDWVKGRLLCDVFAKKGGYLSAFERVFAERFPTVRRLIHWINRRDHGELIRVLQRLESLVVIEHVASRLVDKIPILTLHDAIYGRVQDLPTVEGAFENTFVDLGLRLSVKVEQPAEQANRLVTDGLQACTCRHTGSHL